ncbi:hypothetical protein BJF84_17455 [Rhodococcus sp. CUA-806]|nr:hypothetical protein BJF84_17455 [Rhodococcus sp. CUA-806]
MTKGDALRSGVVFRGSTRLQLRNVSQPEGGRLVTDEVDPVQLPLDCTACDMKASYRGDRQGKTSGGRFLTRSKEATTRDTSKPRALAIF